MTVSANEELTERFASCTFGPDTASDSISVRENGGYSATSYFMDSSGRSKFNLPLQLTCSSVEDVELLKDSLPTPGTSNSGALRFEIMAHNSAAASSKVVNVENVSVVSCNIKGATVFIETELVVRASKKDMEDESMAHSRAAFRSSIINEAEADGGPEGNSDAVRCQLQVTAVLVTTKRVMLSQKGIPGLVAMELGGGVVPLSAQTSSLQTRLEPFIVDLFLTQALIVSVRSVPGSSSGSTIVSLTMMHTNTHKEPVTVTNIAFHPGHSRPNLDAQQENQSMPGGQNAVTDMTKFVKWSYSHKTEVELPLDLKPHEAYSTVITIDAGEDLRSRTFYSPFSVTALVSDATKVVETCDAEWTTGRIAVEPADAFRIDMSLSESSCFVGAPLVVSLRVLNLSTDTRDLMLLMAKDDEKSSLAVKHGSVNTAVVSEVNGYTFGVWGLSGDDDGTTRHNRDSELLAVDAALLLGEVKGQHSVYAELRFVPLREGTLDVPNLKLYDKMEGKWYNCSHMLKIVAATK